jgi:DNA polymerase III epsilon subunit-like protein
MIAYLFDTETTGLFDNRSLPLKKLPEIIEFYGCSVNLESGELINEYETLVRPKSPIPEEIIKITHITNEMVADAPAFGDVADNILNAIGNGGNPIAHNAHFDREIIEIEFERLGRQFPWPVRPLCSVEATVHLKGYALKLAGLHELLFAAPFPEAHRAKNDVKALTRCCVELFKRGEL